MSKLKETLPAEMVVPGENGEEQVGSSPDKLALVMDKPVVLHPFVSAVSP